MILIVILYPCCMSSSVNTCSCCGYSSNRITSVRVWKKTEKHPLHSLMQHLVLLCHYFAFIWYLRDFPRGLCSQAGWVYISPPLLTSSLTSAKLLQLVVPQFLTCTTEMIGIVPPRFRIQGSNQSQNSNTWGKKFQKVLKSKTWICRILAIIYIAFTLHLQLFP